MTGSGGATAPSAGGEADGELVEYTDPEAPDDVHYMRVAIDAAGNGAIGIGSSGVFGAYRPAAGPLGPAVSFGISPTLNSVHLFDGTAFVSFDESLRSSFVATATATAPWATQPLDLWGRLALRGDGTFAVVYGELVASLDSFDDDGTVYSVAVSRDLVQGWSESVAFSGEIGSEEEGRHVLGASDGRLAWLSDDRVLLLWGQESQTSTDRSIRTFSTVWSPGGELGPREPVIDGAFAVDTELAAGLDGRAAAFGRWLGSVRAAFYESGPGWSGLLEIPEPGVQFSDFVHLGKDEYGVLYDVEDALVLLSFAPGREMRSVPLGPTRVVNAQLAANERGDAVVLWSAWVETSTPTGVRQLQCHVARLHDGVLGPARELRGDRPQQWARAIALNEAGQAFVAWTDGGIETNHARVARIDF
ncbi:hypothetical protein [Sorangium sp. So ce1078]|uniref:hypothetical protein n=1 Tax=Sorangium sp. So ce1078 TaxID=3133329 RepID=UPI003F611DAB